MAITDEVAEAVGIMRVAVDDSESLRAVLEAARDNPVNFVILCRDENGDYRHLSGDDIWTMLRGA